MFYVVGSYCNYIWIPNEDIVYTCGGVFLHLSSGGLLHCGWPRTYVRRHLLEVWRQDNSCQLMGCPMEWGAWLRLRWLDHSYVPIFSVPWFFGLGFCWSVLCKLEGNSYWECGRLHLIYISSIGTECTRSWHNNIMLVGRKVFLIGWGSDA